MIPDIAMHLQQTGSFQTPPNKQIPRTSHFRPQHSERYGQVFGTPQYGGVDRKTLEGFNFGGFGGLIAGEHYRVIEEMMME